MLYKLSAIQEHGGVINSSKNYDEKWHWGSGSRTNDHDIIDWNQRYARRECNSRLALKKLFDRRSGEWIFDGELVRLQSA